MSTVSVTNLKHASSTSNNLVLGSDGSVNIGGNGNVSPYTGMVNRIINGGMVIDQRNAGAIGTATGYTIDRWEFAASLSTKGTWQQNAGSVTPPVGFKNYLGFTSNSAYSVASGDYFTFTQPIEGFNVSDLGWGTASAVPVTLSFWVRSSLTGAFGGALKNSGSTRSYPFSYTVNSANTWEYKIITIAGDTSGTWLTTNGVGVVVLLAFGVGTTYSGTAGAWAGSNLVSVTGATSVVGTNGATFYITGVQLEKGSSATAFEFRSIGQELALCQRYFQRMVDPGASGVISAGGSQVTRLTFYTAVNMRANPTVSTSGTFNLWNGTNAVTSSTVGLSFINATNWFQLDFYNLSATLGSPGQAGVMFVGGSGSPVINISAEL